MKIKMKPPTLRMAGLENMPLVCGSNGLPNKKPQNKTKSPSCRHSGQPQEFVLKLSPENFSSRGARNDV